MIRAGRANEIRAESGKWVIIDIGFASKARSCGLLIDNQSPIKVRFGEAVQIICNYIAAQKGPINLLIEAPLSVAFDQQNNPKGRSVEKQNSDTRYWYVGLGSSVMVAALYLVKSVARACPDAVIRLFEGFVSYKEMKNKTNHTRDTMLLKEVIDNPSKYPNCIFSGDTLKMELSDNLQSAFLVADIDAGIPPIIMRNG